VPELFIKKSRWDGIKKLFHDRHDALYGYALREDGTPVELLNLRLSAIGVTTKPALERQPRQRQKALKGKREIYLPERGKFAVVPVYDGDQLNHGNRLAGPAIIESVNTSVVVPPSWVADYDAYGNCILDRQ
jgi:N-methylhydantoinase A